MGEILAKLIFLYSVGILVTEMLFVAGKIGLFTRKRRTSKRSKNKISILFNVSIHII